MRAALLLLALAAVPALAQRPDTTDWHRYAPLVVGNAWHYREEVARDPIGYDIFYRAYEVVGDTVVEGEEWFVVWTCRRAEADPATCLPEQRLYRLDEATASLEPFAPYGSWNEPWFLYPCRLDAPFRDGSVVTYVCADGRERHWAWIYRSDPPTQIGGTPLEADSSKLFAMIAHWGEVVADVGLLTGGLGDPGCGYCFSLVYARLDGAEYGTPRVIVANDPEAPALPAVALTVSPNPLRSTARLSLALDAPQALTLEVYDVRGRLLDTRPLGTHPAGSRSLPFDAAGLVPGLYLLRVTGSAGFAASRGIIVQR